MRNRIYSWSWEFPDDLFAEVFAEYEPKYRAHYGDLERGLTDTHVHQLEIWTFPYPNPKGVRSLARARSRR